RGTEGWFCHHLLAGRWYGAAGRFQAQLYKNREVVGWESTFVAVIQRLMGKNLHPPTHKNIIDPCTRTQFLPVVRCAVRSLRFAHRYISRIHQTGGDLKGEMITNQNLISLSCFSEVKIAGDNNRRFSRNFPNTLQQKLRAFNSGLLAPMIKMGIEVIEFSAALAIAEKSPGDDSRNGGIPGFASRDIRRLGEPECLTFQ